MANKRTSSATKYSPLPSSSSTSDGNEFEISGNLTNLPKLFFKIIVGIAVWVALGAAIYASAWVFFHPPPHFEIISGSISELELTGPELSATWDLTIRAHNPSQVISYKTLVALVSYHSGYPLAIAHVGPFSNPGMNQSVIEAQAVAPAQFLDDDARAMMEDDLIRGIMEFGIDVMSYYSYPCSYLVNQPIKARSCNRVKFEFDGYGEGLSGENGTMMEVYPRECDTSERPEGVKEIWYNVFVVSFIYLLIDIIM